MIESFKVSIYQLPVNLPITVQDTTEDLTVTIYDTTRFKAQHVGQTVIKGDFIPDTQSDFVWQVTPPTTLGIGASGTLKAFRKYPFDKLKAGDSHTIKLPWHADVSLMIGIDPYYYLG